MTEHEEHVHMRRALEIIHEHYGHVCKDFELCQHAGCRDSCAAWMVALAALRGEELPSCT